MKLVVSTIAALVATTGVDGFSISSRSMTSRPTTTAIRMGSSYDDQLKSYSQQGQQQPTPTKEPQPYPVNGDTQEQGNNGVPPPVIVNTYSQPPPPQYYQPPQQYYQPPPQQQLQPVQDNGGEGGVSGIVVTGLAFLGLPIWLLLASQVFGGGNNPVAPAAPAVPPSVPATTVVAAPPAAVAPEPTTPTMALPSTVGTQIASKAAYSDASPAGVVVLSQPITKAEVRGLFNLWNDALHTLDPATVAKRYAKDGVLLPTLSDVPRNDFDAIKDYFVHFLEKKPDGKILEGEIFIGNNWAQDAGIYEFTFEDGSKVKARYSFVYAFEDGQWMISHHHSSLMPEEVVRPKAITKEEVRGLFGLWNDALATGSPQKVADRYTEDAVLLPTLSNEARYTNDRIADYFVHFLEKKPTGKILEGNIKIGPNWAQDAGIYEFTFQDGSSVQGRYSFVYSYQNGEWKISNHHSSIMPEGAVAAMKKVAAMEKAEA